MDLGKKIEQLRLEKGLNRPDFCGDESELTVRQLARIESGQSQPSIPKLEYIAQRLGIPAYSLMPDYKELPQGYLELKYKLLREPMYNKVEVLDKKEQYLDEIEELYCEQLPPEETVWVETSRAILDVIRTQHPEYAVALLETYLPELEEKEVFSLKDLELISLYFVSVFAHIKNKKNQLSEIGKLQSFLLRLIKHVNLVQPEQLFLLSNVIFSGLACLDMLESYEFFDLYIACLQEIMEKTQDFQKKPILLMLHWKHALVVENKYSLAEGFYQKAKLFADMIEDAHLVTMLEKQWQEDLKKYL
ncbi:helix-turn-helix domain-containing protein [Streptococcus suis]|uniref:helix-turn-helix domain-containing protein n=1 Tax=Streptococcus suis TaxID=1307 RepID=UPI000CF3EF8F|nr:XRE family transcriptional regulator [Streptococcus suis]